MKFQNQIALSSYLPKNQLQDSNFLKIRICLILFWPLIINKIKTINYLGIIVIVIKQGFRPLPNVHGRSMSFLNGCLKLFMFFLELFGLGQGAGDWEAGGQHPLGTVDPTDYLKSLNYVIFQIFHCQLFHWHSFHWGTSLYYVRVFWRILQSPHPPT